MDALPVVLIVTPDADLREAAARVLAREGYRVRTGSHAGHAWLVSLEEDRIDILATELATEETSGPALAAKLRRHRPELAAVYFAKCGTTECEGVLVRPFTSDDLLAALALSSMVGAAVPTAAS